MWELCDRQGGQAAQSIQEDGAGAAGGYWCPSAMLPALLGTPRRGWGWRSPSAGSWHWLSGSDFSTSWQRERLWDSRQGCGVASAPGCGTPLCQSTQGEGEGWGDKGWLRDRVAVGGWADR